MLVVIKEHPVYGVLTMLSMYFVRVEYIIKKVSVCVCGSKPQVADRNGVLLKRIDVGRKKLVVGGLSCRRGDWYVLPP